MVGMQAGPLRFSGRFVVDQDALRQALRDKITAERHQLDADLLEMCGGDLSAVGPLVHPPIPDDEIEAMANDYYRQSVQRTLQPFLRQICLGLDPDTVIRYVPRNVTRKGPSGTRNQSSIQDRVVIEIPGLSPLLLRRHIGQKPEEFWKAAIHRAWRQEYRDHPLDQLGQWALRLYYKLTGNELKGLSGIRPRGGTARDRRLGFQA